MHQQQQALLWTQQTTLQMQNSSVSSVLQIQIPIFNL